MAELRNSCGLVALFKEKSKEGSDPYCEALKHAGFSSVVIPTLAFNFINGQELEMYLQNSNDFSGIIFTSARAVEAVYKRLSAIEDSLKVSITSHWKHKMNFSVGEATAKLAKDLLGLDTQGKEAGSSEKLCDVIIGSDPVTKPFLFPCSNIRKDTIPDVLKQNGISVQEIISYETVCNPDLGDCWQEVVSQQGLPQVLVFFSPSGVQWSHQLIKDSYEDLNFFKFVAIGPSTEKALHDVGLMPCEVAKKPNAMSICEAVRNVM